MLDTLNERSKLIFNSCPHMKNSKPFSFGTLVKSQLCGQGVSRLNGFFAFMSCAKWLESARRINRQGEVNNRANNPSRRQAGRPYNKICNLGDIQANHGIEQLTTWNAVVINGIKG